MDCLKIEGRAKSAYYAAIVTGAYRHVLRQRLRAGRPRRPGLARRGGACQPPATIPRASYYGQPGQYHRELTLHPASGRFAPSLKTCDAEGNAVLSLRNKFAAG